MEVYIVFDILPTKSMCLDQLFPVTELQNILQSPCSSLSIKVDFRDLQVPKKSWSKDVYRFG